ncbi:phospholipase D family protein [Peribacillus acanthi]|uniref:phospholipase D family protein n=1 Tax=Peribacillus acanthi TaxID=2171554 RepID=UPI000D3E6089|nr:phospholipase D family protein [Peribacillus acanthi]
MEKEKKTWYKKKRYILPLFIFLIVLSVMLYHNNKPLPEGISTEGDIHTLEDVTFLYDLTYQTHDGEVKHERRIFDAIYKAIEEAEQFVIVDMFLFNGYYDKEADFPRISEVMTEKIIQQKEKHPELEVIFITDEINTTYGSHPAKELEKMKDHGVKVVITNLDRLRDPNPLYSGVWRSFFQWFGEAGPGWVKNPLAENAPDVTVRSYLKLLNVKANHRKILATEKTAIVSSANPHDASGNHSNIAFQMEGNIIQDIVKAEEAVGKFSNGPSQFPKLEQPFEEGGSIKAQFLTEGKITKHVVKELKATKEGDEIWIGMFYLADRKVINAITGAARRGVHVKMVLDPNQNAFGSEKIGLPNLPVAAELKELGEENMKIRWYKTDKEQFHSKLLYIKKQTSSVIIGGSANYTSRNLDDFNLEADVKLVAPSTSEISQEVDQYYHRIWENKDGVYTVDYEEYQDKLPFLKYIVYIIQKTFRFETY